MSNDVVLAVDLGGTNLRMAAVGSDGHIFSHAKTATENANEPQALLDALSSLVDECRALLVADQQVIGIGAGVPANITSEGVLNNLPNLPALEGMNLKAELEAKFALSVVLENDATAAAIGENWLGASKDVRESIMITLGTGVGGGIIIDNKPIRGIDGTAGKLGHICVEPNGHPCGCGSNGCIEQYASATALVRMANEIGLESTTSFEVYEAAKTGDQLALDVFKKMGRYLGITLGGLVNALNPEMIVIGGGAAAAWDAFIDHLTKELKYRAFNEPADRVQIVRGTLDDNAGILGAARSTFTATRAQ